MDDSEQLVNGRHVQASGPFHRPEYDFTVGGYLVPHIQGALVPGSETRWLLALDRRFMLEADDDELQRWMPFLAHAMAVAAGYSCHGEHCEPLNPFTVRQTAVGEG